MFLEGWFCGGAGVRGECAALGAGWLGWPHVMVGGGGGGMVHLSRASSLIKMEPMASLNAETISSWLGSECCSGAVVGARALQGTGFWEVCLSFLPLGVGKDEVIFLAPCEGVLWGVGIEALSSLRVRPISLAM